MHSGRRRRVCRRLRSQSSGLQIPRCHNPQLTLPDSSARCVVMTCGRLALRCRIPGMPRHRTKTSRHEKRPFFGRACAVTCSGDEADEAPVETLEAPDQRELTRLDGRCTIGASIQVDLELCETGNSWMRSLSSAPPIAAATSAWCLTHCNRSTTIAWLSQAELKAMIERDGTVKTGKAVSACLLRQWQPARFRELSWSWSTFSSAGLEKSRCDIGEEPVRKRVQTAPDTLGHGYAPCPGSQDQRFDADHEARGGTPG